MIPSLKPALCCAAFLFAAEAAPLPIPNEILPFGRDLIVGGVLFWFYRQLAQDFRKIVQDNTAALQALSDRIEKRAK